MAKVKICGITNWEDARRAIDLGAAALGFNFHKPSPRFISVNKARRIVARLPKNFLAVGVFVNEKAWLPGEIGVFVGLRALQLHVQDPAKSAAELAERWIIISAFQVRPGFRVNRMHSHAPYADYFLLDGYRQGAHGGTGKTFDWKLARAAKKYGKIFLAGGLKPENVREAILAAEPDFVDVASGVESRPGKKDAGKMREFFREVGAANRELRTQKE